MNSTQTFKGANIVGRFFVSANNTGPEKSWQEHLHHPIPVSNPLKETENQVVFMLQLKVIILQIS